MIGVWVSLDVVWGVVGPRSGPTTTHPTPNDEICQINNNEEEKQVDSSFESTLLIPLLLNSEPCQFLTAIWINILLRLYSYIYHSAYVLFHFALTIERARATVFARRYEKENSSYAIICIVIVWILTAIINGYIVILAVQDKEFMEKPSLTITITTTTTSNYLVLTSFCFLAIIVITAAIDYFLLCTNRQNKSKDVDYSLSRIYQINENIVVMKLLWPLDVCFAVLFAIFLSGSICLRLFRGKLTLVQYVADFTVVQLSNKARMAVVVESGDHTDIHFQQLKSQWTTIQKRSVRSMSFCS
ncbi:serpentine type 7TM GPCR receptor class ab chemoreceptor domain-containing protein [Ditylenchus destructor]|uniref:Serpentine type 7TM GPCR receptor class ab chemoreceptor domain-containing protein n=1 Tax=Ditylenchus destructor TaxID=166010 RepID=A0AAD4QU68_9BILA|nr:serpentine type 7TM GPCR receptor class ab chemoreceptor domain-containing protein [Ditylenchus destructor]